MKLLRLEMAGFKSFAKKTVFQFTAPITGIVGPNGSGKSNVVEAIRFVMGEQSMKSLRGKAGTDLIFKGSNKLSKGSRAGVTLVFDNTDHMLAYSVGDESDRVALDTDEVAISREVYPDGTNRYLINNTEVRLKDVVEVLASAFIGSKAHNIISQGEADHLLNAHPRERKELLEEALGLKLFHVRLKEASRKLDRTHENLRECELLRRELAPHLKFLKKQVERIEAAKNIREELLARVGEYIAHETSAINLSYTAAQKQGAQCNAELLHVVATIKKLESELSAFSQNGAESNQLHQEKNALFAAQRAYDELTRSLGRIEGMIEFARQSVPEAQKSPEAHVPFARLKSFVDSLNSNFVVKLLSAGSLDEVKNIAAEIKNTCEHLIAEYAQAKPIAQTQASDKIPEFLKQKADLEMQIKEAEENVVSLQSVITNLESQTVTSVESVRALEKSFREASVRESTLRQELHQLESHSAELQYREEAQKALIDETRALCGVEPVPVHTIPDQFNTHDALRTIERLKIRLEDLGGGSGGDIIKEYSETEERDKFLEREITDASQSVASLEAAIADLRQQLAEQFNEGLHKVDTAFQDLFTAMFGGGKAKLQLVTIEKRAKKKNLEEGEEAEDVDEEAEAAVEQGVEVAVQLPRKKTTEIEMLSGGERSLTSIALLFALTQVEPPPFLILDETDAALDEANSKRYADLLIQLANHSQLIVVTHNRETMTAAQTLYGVTLGADDASEVLSVELDKAVQYAK